MEFEPIQNENILKAVESNLDHFDDNRLMRSKALLQSDLWTVSTRLDDQPGDEVLLATQKRIKLAIKKVDDRLIELGHVLDD